MVDDARRIAGASAATPLSEPGWLRSYVLFSELAWPSHIASIEAIRARPAPSISTQTFSIKYLLCRRHHLVECVPTGVCGIRVAACLYSLHFR
jgi:hypothetical protein